MAQSFIKPTAEATADICGETPVRKKKADPAREEGLPRLLYSYTEGRQLLGGVPISTWNFWIAIGVFKPIRIGPRRSFIAQEDLARLARDGAAISHKDLVRLSEDGTAPVVAE